jgi:hypothetical protein
MSTKKGLFKRLCSTVYNSYKSVMTRASHRGNRAKGRATSSKFVNRSSEGLNETDRRSKEIRGVGDCPPMLPELKQTDSLGAEQTSRAWADQATAELFTCTGSKFTSEEHAIAEKSELLKQICI